MRSSLISFNFTVIVWWNNKVNRFYIKQKIVLFFSFERGRNLQKKLNRIYIYIIIIIIWIQYLWNDVRETKTSDRSHPSLEIGNGKINIFYVLIRGQVTDCFYFFRANVISAYPARTYHSTARSSLSGLPGSTRAFFASLPEIQSMVTSPIFYREWTGMGQNALEMR